MTYEESAEESARHIGRQADEVARQSEMYGRQTEAAVRASAAIERAANAFVDLCEFVKTHLKEDVEV